MPSQLDDAQRQRLRDLLRQDATWVRRDDWLDFLAGTGAHTDIDTLTPDQQAAAVAWLRQQRHQLHRAVEGETTAPDGWLESLPLYRRLAGR